MSKNPQRIGKQSGMTIVEIAIGVAILGVVAAGALASFISLNKNAVRTRIMTNAKEVVQRNIETAVGLPFSLSNTPTILATTGTSGAVWDDDPAPDNTDNKVNIYVSRDGALKVTGTLLRTVRPEPNSAGADVRRVTFHLDYTVFGTPASYETTTIRALD